MGSSLALFYYCLDILINKQLLGVDILIFMYYNCLVKTRRTFMF